MMARHLLRSLTGATVLLAMTALVVTGLIGCGPGIPKPGPHAQDPLTDQAVPVPTIPTVESPHRSTYLVLRLKERRLDVMQDDATTPLESFPIAIGRAGHETPIGRFQVEEKVEYPHYDRIDPKDRMRVLKRVPPGPQNPLGERWIGFAHGEAWTVGIHGTPHPELLGQAVSGGCIRMRNADVIRIYERVELGTTVIVYP